MRRFHSQKEEQQDRGRVNNSSDTVRIIQYTRGHEPHVGHGSHEIGPLGRSGGSAFDIWDFLVPAVLIAGALLFAGSRSWITLPSFLNVRSLAPAPVARATSSKPVSTGSRDASGTRGEAGRKLDTAARIVGGVEANAAPKEAQVTVVLDVSVDSEGQPTEVSVVRGPGGEADVRAIELVRKRRFEPATRGGVRVPSTIQVTVRVPR
jgi:TonB family protein